VTPDPIAALKAEVAAILRRTPGYCRCACGAEVALMLRETAADCCNCRAERVARIIAGRA